MASNYVCRSCLRSLRNGTPSQRLDRNAISRTFAVSSASHQKSSLKPARPHSQDAQATGEPDTKTMQKQLRRDLFQQPRDGAVAGLAKGLQRNMPSVTGTYQAYGATENMFRAVDEIVGYDVPQVRTKEEVPRLEGGEEIGVATGTRGDEDWYKELGLQPTFNTWAQLTMLHLYVLTTVIRTLPQDQTRTFTQHLVDHFFTLAELKMDTLHSITSRGIRSKYLKDLFLQWRGVLVSYDEGLYKGDAVLAAAVWRNVFGGREDVDPVRLAMVTGWLRREVARCATVGDMGSWTDFGGLNSEESVVLMKSHLMDKPFAAAPAAAAKS